MRAKPYSQACDENREPILSVLVPRLRNVRTLLEIGSGTGQHAVYFAPALSHLLWQTSDLRESHDGILAWLEEATSNNIRAPLPLDVLGDEWPVETYDAVYSANTAHIMSPQAVEAMFIGVGRLLIEGGVFLLYGPFSYNGEHTAASNRRFDAWLRARDPQMGVRDLDWLQSIAQAAGLQLEEDIPMPVNNRTLIWRKRSQIATLS